VGYFESKTKRKVNNELDVLGEEPDAPNGVRVEGYGHAYQGKGSSLSSIAKLEVEPIQLIG
jgi:hypothetical protein